MSALVIGSLSPDFEYFLHLSARGSFGHTVAGLFVLDLPLSLLILWLFHRYVKSALHTLTPGLFPLPQEPDPSGSGLLDWHRWLLVVVSVLMGAVTHIWWDAFTHPGFWPYRHIAILHQSVYLPSTGPVEFYKCLQYGSGILGMAILAILWISWVRKARHKHAPARTRSTLILVGFAIAGAVLRVAVGVDALHGSRNRGVLASEAVITFFALLWLEVVIYGAAIRRSMKHA